MKHTSLHHLSPIRYSHYVPFDELHVLEILCYKTMSKLFVETILYHVHVHSVDAFCRLIFIAAIDYENIFTTKLPRFVASDVFH